MYDFHIEPRLADALADPIVRAVMTADRIDPEAVADDMRNAALRIGIAALVAIDWVAIDEDEG